MPRGGSRSTPTSRPEPVEEVVVDDVEEIENEDGSEEEEEYEVENIIRHRREKNGNYSYLVAWKGYGPEHNTWEPSQNVEHAQEIVSAYWEKQPKDTAGNIKKRKAATPPASKKRGRPRASAASAAAERVEKEASPLDTLYYTDTHRDDWMKYQDVQNWEDLVRSIDTVERTDKETLIVYLTMKGGERFGVPSSVANKRCPQTMLRFYEQHLKWRGSE